MIISWEAIKSDGTLLLSFALAICAHCAVAVWDLRLWQGQGNGGAKLAENK